MGFDTQMTPALKIVPYRIRLSGRREPETACWALVSLLGLSTEGAVSAVASLGVVKRGVSQARAEALVRALEGFGVDALAEPDIAPGALRLPVDARVHTAAIDAAATRAGPGEAPQLGAGAGSLGPLPGAAAEIEIRASGSHADRDVDVDYLLEEPSETAPPTDKAPAARHALQDAANPPSPQTLRVLAAEAAAHARWAAAEDSRVVMRRRLVLLAVVLALLAGVFAGALVSPWYLAPTACGVAFLFWRKLRERRHARRRRRRHRQPAAARRYPPAV